MSGRTVKLVPEQYYHLYNRGNNRGCIFFERENYIHFLRQIRTYLLPVMDIIAYCLMPTHYHLLVRIKDIDKTTVVSQTTVVSNISRGSVANAIMRFSVAYTKAINKRHDRSGRLFQGPYQARLVDSDEYLAHLSRYIHLNPVAAGLAARPEDWEFSSYPEFIGQRYGSLPAPAPVLSQFPDPGAYQNFADSYLPPADGVIAHLLLD